MNISKVNQLNCNMNNINFGNKYKIVTSGMSANSIHTGKRLPSHAEKTLITATSVLAAVALSEMSTSRKQIEEAKLKQELRNEGISMCETTNGQIHASGPHTGYFRVEVPDATLRELGPLFNEKKLILTELQKDKDKPFFGGLRNYKECIDDLGRQDIVKKALNIGDDLIRTNVKSVYKDVAAKQFSEVLNNPYITADKLFFIGEEGFYYDKNNKIVYSLILKDRGAKGTTHIYPNKFIFNEKGETIGYENETWDLAYRTLSKRVYKEQQQSSAVLPEFANRNQRKEYAESYRFGNCSSYPESINKGIENVQNHLSKCGFGNVDKNDIQVVKKKDPQGRKEYVLLYYNGKSGRSLLYDSSGKYHYQIEYIKDPNGNIVDLNKWI